MSREEWRALSRIVRLFKIEDQLVKFDHKFKTAISCSGFPDNLAMILFWRR
jgi:hypothetical protein